MEMVRRRMMNLGWMEMMALVMGWRTKTNPQIRPKMGKINRMMAMTETPRRIKRSEMNS